MEVEKALIKPTISREGWGAGPWDGEPDRLLWRDEATGLTCLANRTWLGSWCGYVAVPPGHPYHGSHYNDVPVDAHGGLTYSEKCQGPICHVPAPGEPDNVWWLGFDCAHFGDLMPRFKSSDGVYRDLPFIRNEVTRLAVSVAKAL